MSKYVSKKVLLEFIKARKAKFAGSYKEIEHGAYLELDTIEAYLESGTFNADESEPDDYESMVLLDAHDQIHRLRAALEDIRYQVQQSDHPAGLGILATINQALSTTTEPTDAAKVERVREGAGNDA